MNTSFAASVFLACVGAFAFLPRPLVAGRWPDGCGDGKTHNFDFGNYTYGDRILNTTQVFRDSSFLRVQSFDVNIVTPGVITYVQVQDQKRDGDSGCVYLQDGGVGFNNVILHFKSARNHGVDFLVNVYGE